MLHIDSAAELVVIAQMVRRLGELRDHLDFDEALKIGNLMRDCADDLDRGAGERLLACAPHDGRRSDGDMAGGAYDSDRGEVDLPSPDGAGRLGGWTLLAGAVSRVIEMVPVNACTAKLPRPRPPARPAARRA